MTAPPPSDWIDQGQNAVWFFGFAFAGFLVLVFGKPIKTVEYKKPAPPPAKRTKRKGKPKAKRAKVAKPKLPKQEVKKEVELSYTPEQIARIEEMFRRGRGY